MTNMKKQIAKDLLSIGAVFLRPEEPVSYTHLTLPTT